MGNKSFLILALLCLVSCKRIEKEPDFLLPEKKKVVRIFLNTIYNNRTIECDLSFKDQFRGILKRSEQVSDLRTQNSYFDSGSPKMQTDPFWLYVTMSDGETLSWTINEDATRINFSCFSNLRNRQMYFKVAEEDTIKLMRYLESLKTKKPNDFSFYEEVNAERIQIIKEIGKVKIKNQNGKSYLFFYDNISKDKFLTFFRKHLASTCFADSKIPFHQDVFVNYKYPVEMVFLLKLKWFKMNKKDREKGVLLEEEHPVLKTSVYNKKFIEILNQLERR